MSRPKKEAELLLTKEEHLKMYVVQLRGKLENFIDFFQQGHDYDLMVYQWWNAKDILGHIAFWHESFARNISDLGRGIKPSPLKGKLSEVNKQSVETTKTTPIEDLIARLKEAQSTIEHFIFDDGIDLIPYKKGSRDYSREEHLNVVSHHIEKHLKDLKKRYALTKDKTQQNKQ